MRSPLLLGYLFALGASLCYAVATVIARSVLQGAVSPLATSVYTLIFGLLFLALFLSPGLGREGRGAHRPRGYLFFGASGVAAGVGVTAMYFGLKAAPVVVVSPVTSVHPLFALLFAHLFLQHLERVTLRVAIGAFLVVLGVVLVGWSQA